MKLALFSKDEYRSRVARFRQLMSEQGVDVAVLSEASSMVYLTGYMESAYYHKTFVVVSVDEEDPYWIGREYTNAPAAELTAYLDDDRLLRYPEAFATHAPSTLGASAETLGQGDAMSFVADVFEQKGWSNKTVGLEYSSRLLPYAYGLSLSEKLPNANWVDITSLIDKCRVIKSDAEMKYVREAGVIADHAFERCLNDIELGARECDVAANLFQSVVGGTKEVSGWYPEGMVLNVGVRMPAIHSYWTDRPLPKNELIQIEIPATRYGYCVALTRSIYIETIDDEIRRIADAVHEAFDDMLPRAVAGNTCDDVARTFEARLEKHSVRCRPWQGYSIGIGLVGQGWCDAGASIRVGDMTVLEPNMVIHQVPAFWLDGLGWIMMSSETFSITPDGPPEMITSVERKMFAK